MKTVLIVLVSLAFLAGLSANAARAGSLAPQPRVVAKYERDFLERSGAQSLEELLNTGIIRYFLTGGQPLLVLVNGRPYATTSADLDTLPISAIERIEVLGSDSLGTLGGATVRGALNVVLRKDLDGFETRGVARMPSRAGGDGWQGGVFWGGRVGEGRMTLGVDILSRQEITARSRDYSRSVWRKGGSFDESKNVSVSGNTVWVVQRDAGGSIQGVRSAALGDCDPAHGYTGPLSNPPGIRSGDKGCGFAYGNIMWNTSRFVQKSAILNLDHPIGEDATVRLDANVGQGNSTFRYAPPVGVFGFTPNQGVIDAINAAAGSTIADADDLFAVGHRFVSHGNRDWHTKYEEFDVSLGVEGRLAKGLGYDARIDAYALDGSVSGDTFVHTGRIRADILAGNYDLVNPFSKAPEHRRAIERSSLREEVDFGGQTLTGRLALEGAGFAIGGRKAAWTAGVEASHTRSRHIMAFRSRDGRTHDVFEVLGSGGTSYSGKRNTIAAFAEMSLPLADNLDLRLAGRRDSTDDVGQLKSWLLAVEYRPIDIIALRSSWTNGQRTPPMSTLHSTAAQGHPYIECDPGPGPPPRSCPRSNPRQVKRITTGNPKLDPSDNARLAIGAEIRRRPYFLGVEWYRLSRSGLTGRNSADWQMRNLDECTGNDKTNCIDRTGGDVTIHDRYENVVKTELSGITARFGGGFRTDWGVFGMRSAWRHVTSAKLRVAGKRERYVVARDMVRAGFLARRGGFSAVWTTNYRSGFKNSTGTGTFKSWLGHDLVLDWKAPMGLNGARIAAGVFNITDTKLTVDTANPNSVDGPTEAGWGRTFFVTLNAQF